MYKGSLYGSGVLSFAVWGYVIGTTDKDGVVELNPHEIANILGDTTAEDIERVIEGFCEPDPRSRSKDHEGRRLIRQGEYDYLVVNHAYYRGIRSEEERREYNRIKQQESRDRKKKEAQEGGVKPVNDNQQPSAMSAHTDTDTDADTDNILKPLALTVPTRDNPIAGTDVLETLKQIGQTEITKAVMLKWQIVALFSYWMAKTGKAVHRTRLTLDRWDRSKKYIEMWDLETCLYAIDGAMKHPHMNQEGKEPLHEYDEIFMRRSDGPGRVEKLSNWARKKDEAAGITKHALLVKHPQLDVAA